MGKIPSLPSAELSLVQLDKRVAQLEATSPGGTGIDFNKDNNSPAGGGPANYLQIVTNGDGQGPGAVVNPAGVSIVNATDNGSSPGGMEFVNDNDGEQALVQTGDGGQTIENDGAGTQLIKSTVGPTVVENDAETVTIGTSGSNKLLTMYVKDGDIHWLQGGSGGTPIMALIFDGGLGAYQLHLQTGTAVIFDL